MVRRIKIDYQRKAIVFRNGKPEKLYSEGKHWIRTSLSDCTVKVYDEAAPWLVSEDVRKIVQSGVAGDALTAVSLGDNDRALVWIDKRFGGILGPGDYAYWNTVRKVELETVSAQDVQFEHRDLDVILGFATSEKYLETFTVQEGYEGLYFLNSKLVKKLAPGRYAFWKNAGKVKLYHKNLKEQVLDISGQELMTLDKVSIRLNAALAWRIVDTEKAVLSTEEADQSLYREAQLAIRATLGTKDLDAVLTEKDLIAEQMLNELKSAAAKIGIEIISLGIRDIILPGEMKTLLNRVTEAKKAAEANLITRREEVAAIRSQLNTAKLLEENAALMRMRELEALERIAEKTKLNVILGNEKLSDKVINIL